MARRIHSIHIENCTSIRSAEVDLQDLSVLIGPNGAGKSNLVAVFELLGRIVDGQLRREVARAGGAHALIHDRAPSASALVIEIQGEAVGYALTLERSANDELFFGREALWLGDRAAGRDEVSLGTGHKETALRSGSGDAVVLAGLVEDLLRGCRVHHFQDTSLDAAVKQFAPTSDQAGLHPDASNLAPFLMGLRIAHPASYRRIQRTVRAVAPFFQDFVLEEEVQGHVRLRWRQEGSDTVFGAEALSDGTLRFICLATLLLQAGPPELLILDEPELGLHPAAIVHLAEMLRAAAVASQVVVATQSVTLLDQLALEDIVVVERHEGASEFNRPKEEDLRSWVDDYSVGELWLKNLIGGRPGLEWRESAR